jgi:hypothetical protein
MIVSTADFHNKHTSWHQHRTRLAITIFVVFFCFAAKRSIVIATPREEAARARRTNDMQGANCNIRYLFIRQLREHRRLLALALRVSKPKLVALAAPVHEDVCQRHFVRSHEIRQQL